MYTVSLWFGVRGLSFVHLVLYCEAQTLAAVCQVHIVHIFLIPNESSVHLPDHIPVHDPAASLMPQSLDF